MEIYPEGHSAKWWKQHPAALQKALQEMSVRANQTPPSSMGTNEKPSAWQRIFGLAGFAFVLGGAGVISFAYATGVCLVYFGFSLLFREAVFNPWILRNTELVVQCSIMLVVLIAAGAFTLSVVLIAAPLEVYPFGMFKATYADGTDVEGIKWNAHFTDIRVMITNNGDEDYEKVNLVIEPSSWINKAVVVGNHSTCDLSVVVKNILTLAKVGSSGKVTPALTHSGDAAEIHDDQGNLHKMVATTGGYRLTCPSLARGSTVTLLFAAVSPNASTMPSISSDNADFDQLLGQRPSPAKLGVFGSYKRWVKVFNVNRILDIKPGS